MTTHGAGAGNPTESGTDTTTDQELQRLELEKRKAEAAAAIAASQVKRLQTLMPSQVTALAGNATVTGDDVIECRILGMQALAAAAERIAKDVEAKAAGKTVLFHNEQDIAALTALRVFDAQLTQIEASLELELRLAREALAAAESAALIKTESLAAVAGVSAALKTAADLVSLFRVDVDLKYKVWAISDATLAAAVARELIQAGVSVSNHALMPLSAFNTTSKLVNRIMLVVKKRSDVEGVLADLKHKESTLDAEVQDLKNDLAKAMAAAPPSPTDDQQTALSQIQQKLPLLERAIARLQPAGAAFDAFQSALMKPDPGATDHPFTRLLRAEALQNVGDCVWLALKSTAAGGGLKTKRFLWWPTDKVLYSGGAIVEYLLFDRNGTVLTAGVVSEYSGFIEIRYKGSIQNLF